jgi:signal transduction histidine kinase
VEKQVPAAKSSRHADETGLEVEWQDRVLRRLLAVGCVLAVLVLVFWFIRTPWSQLGSTWWVVLAGTALFATLARVRAQILRVRAVAIIAVFCAVAVLTLLRLGFLLGPGLALILVVVLTRIFLTARLAWWALGVTAATVVVAGVAVTHGLVPPMTDPARNMERLDSWVRAALAYLTLGSMLLAVIQVVLGRQDRIIAEKTEAVARAEAEQRERKIANEARAQAEAALLHARKMEAIGTLAGGIAHDFNNILGAVMGFAELARLDAAENRAVQEDVGEIVRAATRAKELVNQILAIGHEREGERRRFALQEVIQDAVKLLRAALPSSVEIRTMVDDDCGPVLGDLSELHCVLMNLVTNVY